RSHRMLCCPGRAGATLRPVRPRLGPPVTASPPRPLAAFQAYLFDVDGTLVYPGQAIRGAAEALAALKRAGKRTLVVTNNSVFSRAEMAARLQGFGFPIEEADVATALVATAAFIAQ